MELNELKRFEDACKVERLDPKKVLPDFSGFPKKDRKSMAAHAKLVIIVRAANRIANGGKEWKPNFSDHSQYKYENWFVQDNGSSGFRFGVCGVWSTGSSVGSRLCFKSSDLAKYAGTQFIDLYSDFMTL